MTGTRPYKAFTVEYHMAKQNGSKKVQPTTAEQILGRKLNARFVPPQVPKEDQMAARLECARLKTLFPDGRGAPTSGPLAAMMV
jgi:hypothetical protein